MDMIKTSASRFKAKLGQYMREVRAGREVLVTDRDQPVAKLVPVQAPPRMEGLPVWKPRAPGAPPLGKVAVRGLAGRAVDSLAFLREDRERR